MTAPPYRDPSDVPLGSILGGRYRLEDVVGEGATSRVYRAEDAESGVDVAIKVFAFAGRAANKSFRRFVRELQINAELRHSAFPDLLDSGYVDESGAPYRAFVCQTINPWNFPAKDRSGRLDLIEEPHLGRLMAKIRGPVKPASERLAYRSPPPAATAPTSDAPTHSENA